MSKRGKSKFRVSDTALPAALPAMPAMPSPDIVFVACGPDAGRALDLPHRETAVLVSWTTRIEGNPHLVVLVGTDEEIRTVTNSVDFAPSVSTLLVALPSEAPRTQPTAYRRRDGYALPSILHGLSEPPHSEVSTLRMFNQTLFVRVEPEPLIGDLPLVADGAQTVLLSSAVAANEPKLREAVERLCSRLDELWCRPHARRLVLSWPSDGEPAGFQDWARERGTPVAILSIDGGPQSAWSTSFDWSVIVADTHDVPASALLTNEVLDRLAPQEPAYRLSGSSPVSLCGQCWRLFREADNSGAACTFHPGPVCDYNSGSEVEYDWRRQTIPTTADYFDCCVAQVLGSSMPPGCTTGRHVARPDSQ